MITGYMCSIDFECELGSASGGNKVYPSIEDLKDHHPMWKECGISKVFVTRTKVVVEPDWEERMKPIEERGIDCK